MPISFLVFVFQKIRETPLFKFISTYYNNLLYSFAINTLKINKVLQLHYNSRLITQRLTSSETCK